MNEPWSRTHIDQALALVESLGRVHEASLAAGGG